MNLSLDAYISFPSYFFLIYMYIYSLTALSGTLKSCGYNQGMQKSIMWQMAYSSRRPCWVPFEFEECTTHIGLSKLGNKRLKNVA